VSLGKALIKIRGVEAAKRSSENMVTVRVIRSKDGTAKSDARVSVYFGMLRNKSRDGRTNSRGEVHFDVDPGDYRVTINGSSYADDHHLSAGVNVIYADV
jgi:hypothetical protein